MGGDNTSPDSPPVYSKTSSLDQDFPEIALGSPTIPSGSDRFGATGENGEARLVFRKDFEGFAQASSNSLYLEANQKRVRNVYMDVLKSYDETQFPKQHLEEGKRKILSYTPGSWVEEVGGMKLDNYDIPKKMTLLVIGPKGSGKSSLINKISRVFENDPFTPERAQVSYSSVGDGTYFLQEYTMPRGSSSVCLYDTRGLSDDLTENLKTVKQWMTKGVRHGKLIIRDSDDVDLKTRMKCKARQNSYCANDAKAVNCVIFVVDALSILESMDSDDETKRRQAQAVASTFNIPFLSFKDDKPVVVLTHGDLLSLSDRVRIRMYLGQLLRVHPKKQIFDIPERDDLGTELTILNMLRYCLEHADKNLPFKTNQSVKGPFISKILVPSLLAYAILVILLGMGMIFMNILHGNADPVPNLHPEVLRSHGNTDWHASEVDPGPTLQHVNADMHTSDIDSVPNLDSKALRTHVNIDRNASEVDSVLNLQPETSQPDVNIDWGAIRHLWLDSVY